MSLTGKSAIITGATGHLGTVVARHFAGLGVRVALAARDGGALVDVARSLPAGSEALTVPCDVSDEEQVTGLVAQVHGQWGGPDILLNIVGGYAFGQKLHETELKTWRHMLDLNLTTAFLCSKHVLPLMLEQGYGRIISVSSKVAFDLPGGAAAYAVAKEGVNALTTCLAKEVKGTGVVAMAVAPSMIDSPEAREQNPKADFSKWVAPEVLAETMATLAGEAGGAMNGSIVKVFGGVG
jgi:NAD(P)-dependent dehydrogenase (short-subunit alcohol dehydrogenase family)